MTERSTEGRPGGCSRHPARPPVGRCARCRAPVCAECLTRLDGILHCRDCLGAEAQRLESAGIPWLPRLGTCVLAAGTLAAALGLSLVSLRIAGHVVGPLSRLGALAGAGGEGAPR